MATTPTNNKTRSGSNSSVFPSAQSLLSAAVNINQGDLVALDTTNHILKAVTLDADDVLLLGVSPVTIVAGKIQGPYAGLATTAQESFSDVPGPEFGNVYKLKLHAADAFNPGDKVYLSVADDAQTVTSSSNAGARHAIGIYQGVAVASAAAGQLGEVKIGCTYPAGTLSF